MTNTSNEYVIGKSIHTNNMQSSEILGRVFGSILCGFSNFLIFSIITSPSYNMVVAKEVITGIIGIIVLILGISSFFIYFKIQYYLKTISKIEVADYQQKSLSKELNEKTYLLYKKLYNIAMLSTTILVITILINLLYFNISDNYLSSLYINISSLIFALVISHNIYRIKLLKNYTNNLNF